MIDRAGTRSERALRTVLVAVIWAAAAAGAGLTFNALRPQGLQLIAPFSYAHDCPDKLDPGSATVDARRALAMARDGAASTLLIDARPAELFERGHPAGARSVPYSFLAPFDTKRARTLKGRRHLFVYCDSPGDRMARVLADQMRQAGLSQVKVVKGGWAALCRELADPPSTGCPDDQPPSSPSTPGSTRAATSQPAGRAPGARQP